MLPDIPPGSYAVFTSFWRRGSLRNGDVIRVNHPQFGVIIKYIHHIDADDQIWLAGANGQSVTTEAMGPVYPEQISGKCCYIVKAKPIPSSSR